MGLVPVSDAASQIDSGPAVEDQPISYPLVSQTLLSVAELVTSCREPAELLRQLSARLQSVLHFNVLALSLHDPKQGFTYKQVPDTAALILNPLPELPAGERPSGWVIEMQQPLIVPDVKTETRWPRAMVEIRAQGIESFCCLPLTTAHRRIGALGIGSWEPVTYAAREVAFLGEVAKLVAVVIENALNFDMAQASQRRLQLLLDLTNNLGLNLSVHDVLKIAMTTIRGIMQSDIAGVGLLDPESGAARNYVFDCQRSDDMIQDEAVLSLEGTVHGQVLRTGKPWVGCLDEFARLTPGVDPSWAAAGFKTGCALPIVRRNRILGVLGFGRRENNPYTQDEVDFLVQFSNQVAIAVENALAVRQIEQLKAKLDQERMYLESEIRTEHHFEDIVGKSPALRRVLQQTEIVASTDSTVLLLGETGTGKELIARAIHDRSRRRERTFVKLNCASIPSGLLESALFGHEKGAFTGAIARQIGRFEVADGGTLFLDEVGEIPLELQSKLLRVLQDQEFERVGGSKTIKVDVRLVAATNRDLSRMVAEQHFRDDLYYRLNVFPISIPPLRERAEDIPALVRYFVHRFARRMNRRIEVIPREALDALQRYAWPGNVRELANLVERAMILSSGPKLEIPLAEIDQVPFRRAAPDIGRVQVRELPPEIAPNGIPASFKKCSGTLKDFERAHILDVLQETKWVISGPRGAAARLGMRRTTLHSLMKRLGISRHI